MPSDYMNHACKQIFEEAKLALAILFYLDARKDQKISVQELADFFEVRADVIRACLISCLRNGLVATERKCEVTDIFYWIKNNEI